MDVVIKRNITFECLIIKRNYKSHGVKIEKGFAILSKLRTFFKKVWLKKSLIKT